MTELGRHIVLLLLSNDCVIIPDFGGFIVHHVDALYDEAEGVYYPPRKSLGFNPSLKMNDSLMAYSYAEAYDISLPEAMGLLQNDVEHLVRELQTTGLYEIDDVGVIRLSSNGAYVFEPYESGILSPSLYGLDSFEAIPLEYNHNIAKHEAEKIDDQQNQTQKTTQSIATSDEQTSDEASDEADEIGKKYILIPRKWVKYSAIACVILLVLLIVPIPANTIVNTFKAGQIDSSMLYRLLPKSLVTKNENVPSKDFHVDNSTSMPKKDVKPVAKQSTAVKTEVASDSKSLVDSSKIAPKKPLVEVSKVEKKPFSIVLASRVSKSNAEFFVKSIAEKGYKEGRVTKMSHGYRVLYGQYVSMEEANNAKRELDDNPLFSECWVMETK